MSRIIDTIAQLPAQSVTNATQPQISPAAAGILFLVVLVAATIALIALWKVFVKAGRPGWAALVPFYNAWVLSEIAGRPGWFGLVAVAISLVTNPIEGIKVIGGIVSILMIILISMDVAVKFGRSKAFGVVGLWLFSVVGYLILAFGTAKYDGSIPTDTPKFGEPTKHTALPKS